MATITELDQAGSLYRRGEYAVAINLYEQARSARRDSLYQAFIDENVAQCLRRMGHVSEAIISAKRGIERLARLPITPTLGELLVTEANCAADMERHTEAFAALSRAEKIYRELEDNISLAQVQVAVARSLAATGQDQEAVRVLDGLLQTDLPIHIRSQVLNNLAVLRKGTNPRAAQALLEDDLDIQAGTGDDYGICITEINLAGIAIDLGEKTRARQLLSDARKHARAANAIELEARIRMLNEDIENG